MIFPQERPYRRGAFEHPEISQGAPTIQLKHSPLIRMAGARRAP